MPIAPVTNYASLIANLSDYIARDDLEEYYPVFIQMAEKRLNSGLKALGMQATGNITLDANARAVLPDDYIEWISVLYYGPAGTRPRQLRYVEPNSPEYTYRFRPNGPPQYYTIAANTLTLAPRRTGSIDLTYYQRLPALSAAAPTNWLIRTAPQLYLYAALGEAYVFQKDEARAAEWLKMAEDRLAQFVQESNSGKIGRRAERAAEDAAEIVAAKALN